MSAALDGVERPAVRDRTRPICMAILAMGGQGGGVLTDWIVAAAEHAGWVAQSTSVPGVAQRTGATIYYVETMPARDGRAPVLSLMPTPGDVDVVLAAEFMEAGRSMLRGLVTPDRTTLIASTHRALAIGEKERPGNGIASPVPVNDAAAAIARRAVLFDMQALAEKNGSVISATLFGALAGSGVLPFSREHFEAAIRAGGKGVEASLRAFAAGFDRARDPAPPAPAPAAAPASPPIPQAVGTPVLDHLLKRLWGEVPDVVRPIVFAGLQRVVDYQDPEYGTEYLDRVAALLETDRRFGGERTSHALTATGAKYIAVAMCYDDVIRVADLKTRASRFARVDREVGRRTGQLLYVTEFMHPRMDEVMGVLPAGLARWIENRPGLVRRLDRVVNRGRRVRTGTIGWFLSLYAVSALKPVRRRLYRHGREVAHIESWLAVMQQVAGDDYSLAVEVLACRRLVKGYSDTHHRGTSKFSRVLAEAPGLVGRPDAAGWLCRLKEAALADEDGATLDGALRTLHSAFDEVPEPTAG